MIKRVYILMIACGLALAATWYAAPVRADDPYTVTVTSNITATLGCYQNVSAPWCTQQCTDCVTTVCATTLTGAFIGGCATVYTDVLGFSVSGSAAQIVKGTWQNGDVRWMIGAFAQETNPPGAHTVDFEISTPFGGAFSESSDAPLDWTFPSEPLRPFSWSRPVSRDVFNPRITPQNLWDAARTALTAYTIVSGNNSDTWMVYAIVLLIPLAGMIIYRLLTDPPDI